MRTPTSLRVPAALLAASAWSIAPTSAADPAPQSAGDSCAALSEVQHAIDDLRDKTNAYLANPTQAGAEDPASSSSATSQAKTPAPTTTASPTATASPAAGKLQSIVDSLRHISAELKSAAPTVADSPLRNSTDKLAGTVNDAADSVSQIAASQANSLNPLKLGSLGVSITGAAVIYQANYNRVCGQNPAGQAAPTTAPTTAAPANTSAQPKQSVAPSPQQKSPKNTGATGH